VTNFCNEPAGKYFMFASHKVSDESSQLCCYVIKVATHNMQTNGFDHISIKLCLQKELTRLSTKVKSTHEYICPYILYMSMLYLFES
jgi:hypothetical protein